MRIVCRSAFDMIYKKSFLWERNYKVMDVTLIMRIAGVGILVTVANSILSKSGRDEQSVFVTIAGIIIVLLMLVNEIDVLFTSVRSIFGL